MKTARRVLLLLFSASTSTNPLLAQWVQTNGPSSGPVHAIAGFGTNLLAGTAFGGVFLSTNNGTSWSAINSGVTNSTVFALAVRATNLFAGTWGGVFLSTNNGASWTTANVGLTNFHVKCFAQYDTLIFTGTWGGVFLSTDNGTSWTAANTGLTYEGYVVNALAVGGTNLFAGISSGNIFLSSNKGTNWTKTGLDQGGVNALATSGPNLFAGTAFSGVFLSTNDGTSWTEVNTGLTDARVQALATSGTSIFVGTYSGVFLSTNIGTSWTAVNTGMKDTVMSLAVIGTNLFAGTYGGWVWRRPLSEMITSVETLSTAIHTLFSLGQNYPNPFNPSTTISFHLPSESFVSLKVYDLLGREVSVLLLEELSPGRYAREWNARELPSGVYFYRLQAGDFMETKKLTLFR